MDGDQTDDPASLEYTTKEATFPFGGHLFEYGCKNSCLATSEKAISCKR